MAGTMDAALCAAGLSGGAQQEGCAGHERAAGAGAAPPAGAADLSAARARAAVRAGLWTGRLQPALTAPLTSIFCLVPVVPSADIMDRRWIFILSRMGFKAA